MWTAQEFVSVIERHPDGGTLWSHTKRMVRYVRVFRANQTVVAVMTEKWVWRGKNDESVELFVKSPAGTAVAEFPKAEKSPKFLESLLESPILNLVKASLLPKVKGFISTPDKTYLYTW